MEKPPLPPPFTRAVLGRGPNPGVVAIFHSLSFWPTKKHQQPCLALTTYFLKVQKLHMTLGFSC